MGAIEVDGMRVDADPLHPRSRPHREQIRQIRLRAQMVFQEFNLFPHLRVIDNLIEAPIRVKGMPRDEAIAIAERFLDKVGLRDKRDEYPSAASPAARSSASRSPGRSRWSPRCCCSTSPRPRSTRRSSARCSRHGGRWPTRARR